MRGAEEFRLRRYNEGDSAIGEETEEDDVITDASWSGSTRREVCLLDNDCFYAQCEELRLGLSGNEAVAVTQKHIVVTANFPARAHGIKKLQSIDAAKQACPNALFISGEDISTYKAKAKEIVSTLQHFFPTCTVEKAGLDETYVELTSEVQSRLHTGSDPPFCGTVHTANTRLKAHNATRRPMDLDASSQPDQSEAHTMYSHMRRLRIASNITQEMRDLLLQQTGIRASAGVSTNKLCAKLCLVNKPGLTILPPREAAAFIAPLHVRVIPGVGHRVDERLRKHGIERARDLRQYTPSQLECLLDGNPGLAQYLAHACYGIDHSPVCEKGPPSTVSVEDSFKECASLSAAEVVISKLSPDLIRRYKEDVVQHDRKARTLRVSWRNASEAPHSTCTRRQSASAEVPPELHNLCDRNPQAAADAITKGSMALLQKQIGSQQFQLKLINIAVCNIQPLSSDAGDVTTLENFVSGQATAVSDNSYPSDDTPAKPLGPLSKSAERARREQERGASCVACIDIKSFYVSVERADDPSLCGKPVCVEQFNSGGFVALSEEAKAAGLRPGDGVGLRGRQEIQSLKDMGAIGKMEAKEKCPGLVILPMRPDRYREVTKRIKDVLHQQRSVKTVYMSSYDDAYLGFDDVMVYSETDELPENTHVIDEDATGCVTTHLRKATRVVARCLSALSEELSLPAVGAVSTGKLFSRLAVAREEAKQAGLAVVALGSETSLAKKTRIQSMPGLQAKLGKQVCDATNIDTVGDLESWSDSEMKKHFGERMSLFLNRALHGQDPTLISERAQPVTITSERSFTPLTSTQEVGGAVQQLALTLWGRMLEDLHENGRLPASLQVQWRQGYGSGMKRRSQHMPQDAVYELWNHSGSSSTSYEGKATTASASIKDGAVAMLQSALQNEEWNITRLALVACYTQRVNVPSLAPTDTPQARISSFVGNRKRGSEHVLEPFGIVSDTCLRNGIALDQPPQQGGWCSKCARFALGTHKHSAKATNEADL